MTWEADQGHGGLRCGLAVDGAGKAAAVIRTGDKISIRPGKPLTYSAGQPYTPRHRAAPSLGRAFLHQGLCALC